MCEVPKFARHLKWACPNRKWACPSKNGRGPVKREARGICRICHVVNPALEEPGVTENRHKITKITKDNEIFDLTKTPWI